MPLNPRDHEVYSWQMAVTGFGQAGQEKLKSASILISRCGGLGSVVAYELAAAGVGKLILAHGGCLKPSDLNRQILMTDDWIGKPRVESASRRLRELKPDLEVTAVAENVGEKNAADLVRQADLIIDCAPLFEERYLLNREAVLQRKPMVECAVFSLEAHLTTLIPGQTPCLQCLYPEKSATWQRQFPVFGAVSGAVGCLAAMEAIKVLTSLGRPLMNRLLTYDLMDMSFRHYNIRRDPDCKQCRNL